MAPLERPVGKPVRCEECRGTGYAEPAPGFTFGNDCPVCHGEGWLSVSQRMRPAGFTMRIENIHINLCDDPELIALDRDGEGGYFSIREFADMLHKFISERL